MSRDVGKSLHKLYRLPVGFANECTYQYLPTWNVVKLPNQAFHRKHAIIYQVFTVEPKNWFRWCHFNHFCNNIIIKHSKNQFWPESICQNT